ncbi:MAG: GNAT family N-acetyltransferase [Chloroflexota bacterium]
MLIRPIETSRLRLRCFESQDWTAVHTYAGDPAVMHYMEEGAMTQNQAQAWVESNLTESAQAFPVILKDSAN